MRFLPFFSGFFLRFFFRNQGFPEAIFVDSIQLGGTIHLGGLDGRKDTVSTQIYDKNLNYGRHMWQRSSQHPGFSRLVKTVEYCGKKYIIGFHIRNHLVIYFLSVNS